MIWKDIWISINLLKMKRQFNSYVRLLKFGINKCWQIGFSSLIIGWICYWNIHLIFYIIYIFIYLNKYHIVIN